MAETKNLSDDFLWFEYDDSGKPFDFIGTDTETALIFVTDETLRNQITEDLKNRDFYSTEAKTVKEALKKMRFHTYTLMVIDENFDTADPGSNDLIRYLANIPMSDRRRMFVTLISRHIRSLDRMAALDRSVNMIINVSSMKDFITLVTNGMAENEGFYYTFAEIMKTAGKV